MFREALFNNVSVDNKLSYKKVVHYCKVHQVKDKQNDHSYCS